MKLPLRYDPSRFHIKEKVVLIDLLDKDKKVKAQAIIDKEDFSRVYGLTWYLNQYGYVVANSFGTTITLSRLIMNEKGKLRIDHKDGKKLNNRKDNLRSCTPQQNSRARHCMVNKRNAVSAFKGVSINKKRGTYYARIGIGNNKSKYLGTYISEKEAALAYNEEAKKIYGEFAVLNTI